MEQSKERPTAWICATCGTQFAASIAAPSCCPICVDERQYVGWGGQQWRSPEALALSHQIHFANEGGVVTMRVEPSFAIGQRAFLIPDRQGFVMWECLSLVTDAALQTIREMGGLTKIAISHPHFYGAMVRWSEALDNVPIYLHAADRAWMQYPSDNIRLWEGERLTLSDRLELVHLPGHFAGSCGLWWKDGPRAGGSLFPGDAIQVAMDRHFTSFMYSYPNAIPLGETMLRALEGRVDALAFDDVFGFSLGRQILGDGKARVEASFARYRAAIAA